MNTTTEQQPSAAPATKTPNDGLSYMVDDERKAWREKGLLPERFIRDDSPDDEQHRETQRKPPPENPLADLTPEERKDWRDNGKLPAAAEEKSRAASKEEPRPDQGGERQTTAAIEPTTTPPAPSAAQHQQNYTHLTQAMQSEGPLKAAAANIHLDADRGGVVLHALADLPANQRVLVAKELASRPDVQAKLLERNASGQYFHTREQVAALVHAMARGVSMAQREEAVFVVARQRVAEARKKYPDFDKVALAEDLPIPPGGVIFTFGAEEERGPEVIYHLGKNRAVLKEILALPPLQQHRKLLEIERSLDDGPPRTSASKPPREVGGRGTQPDDPGDAAVDRKDVRSAFRSWNDKVRSTGKLR